MFCLLLDKKERGVAMARCAAACKLRPRAVTLWNVAIDLNNGTNNMQFECTCARLLQIGLGGRKDFWYCTSPKMDCEILATACASTSSLVVNMLPSPLPSTDMLGPICR